MAELKKETGNRYGRLVVIERAPNKGKRNCAAWLCRCDCGNEIVVTASALRTGNTKSCGCYRREVSGQRLIDEIGNRHGKLVVLERAPDEGERKRAAWLCQCDCGNKAIVRGTHLRKGDIKSCGCLTAAKDEIGNRHGRLVVLERASNKRGKAAWRCRCDCGNETIVVGLDLRRGVTKSCGCLVKLPEGEAAFNRVFRGMKRHAKERGYIWQLTKSQARELTKRPCHYCGAEPAQKCQEQSLNGFYVYNGLDRVDNDRGYEIDNVVPCCGFCNRAKFTAPVGEFKEWIARVYHYCVEHVESAGEDLP